MRIISGKLKARRFSVSKSFPSRPTTDFAKEGLFNVLEHQLDMFDLTILDLCAGTGNISFEFLSRESGNVTAVDNNSKCLWHIKKHAENFGISDQLSTVKSDILTYLDKIDKTYDIIFADPPYNYEFHQSIHTLVFNRNLLNKNGLLIIEHGKFTDLSSLPHFGFTRIYGNVYFSCFRPN